MSTKILTPSQAESVAAAMCALNNVCGRMNCKINERIIVRESIVGHVYVIASGEASEYYENQHAFMTAYGVL